MHIILGVLGSIVTVLWLLHRLAEMGIDLGGLNPWLWRRRRRWRQQYQANPIFSLQGPMDATALLLVATAKVDGDISSEEKRELLRLFETEFHQSKRDAAGLMISSTHLLGSGEEVRSQLPKVLKPSLDAFTPEQAQSALELMQHIAEFDGKAPSPLQSDLIGEASQVLGKLFQPREKWA